MLDPGAVKYIAVHMLDQKNAWKVSYFRDNARDAFSVSTRLKLNWEYDGFAESVKTHSGYFSSFSLPGFCTESNGNNG